MTRPMSRKQASKLKETTLHHQMHHKNLLQLPLPQSALQQYSKLPNSLLSSNLSDTLDKQESSLLWKKRQLILKGWVIRCHMHNQTTHTHINIFPFPTYLNANSERRVLLTALVSLSSPPQIIFFVRYVKCLWTDTANSFNIAHQTYSVWPLPNSFLLCYHFY